MGAYVVYDPYWDRVWAYADEVEAKGLCEPGRKHAGCHVMWHPDAEPGDTAGLPAERKIWDDDGWPP